MGDREQPVVPHFRLWQEQWWEYRQYFHPDQRALISDMGACNIHPSSLICSRRAAEALLLAQYMCSSFRPSPFVGFSFGLYAYISELEV
jgi:hypothetical protein